MASSRGSGWSFCTHALALVQWCNLWYGVVLQAGIWEWGQLLSEGAYVLMAQHPAKFALAALAGYGVNMLAIMVIHLASSLTLKVSSSWGRGCGLGFSLWGRD